MPIILTFVFVVLISVAVAFGMLWYLQRDSVRQAREEYENQLANIDQERKQILARADVEAAVMRRQAQQTIAVAEDTARRKAEEVRRLEEEAGVYRSTARAMRNIVEGYGDTYLQPAHSILDDLAEGYGHREAGEQLKQARKRTRAMVAKRRAALSDYADPERKHGAERFITDAFNGKVDSILSRTKHDNFGTLEQEIKDAFAVVNRDGQAFRRTQILPDFLNARLQELRWASVVHELRRQEQEEQRRIREQLREEEKARRDFDRAKLEAAKEESMLRSALAAASERLEQATAEQRAQYEAQLAELGARLAEAEERNRRAISMAQQTKQGHVYVISNIGSFGDDVFKIGLTRRLDPLDRVRELGDASVPFAFDVHAIIWSDDAPALENRLHKHFVLNQVNKVNHRKEFFRASIAEIRKELEDLGIETHWTMVAQAQEYRETIAIERTISSNESARQQWIDRQLTLDPVDHAVAVGENGDAAYG
jgi:hypothetical protein